jgi:MFS transporter, CP family, cyanate transporter
VIGHGRPPPGLLLSLLWLVALNLRTLSIGVSPVLPLIRVDLGISYAAGGLLFALPVAIMGLGAVPGARLADRLGTWRAVALSLALLSLGGGLRAVAPGYGLMLALTVLFAAGIGLAQPSLPRLVREWFPQRRASATGVYTAGLVGGAVVAAAATGPLLSLLGAASWRGTCVVWAALAAASLVAWLGLGPRRGPPAPGPAGADPAAAGGLPPERAGEGSPGLPLALRDVPVWRDRIAWLITLVFLLQGLIFYQLTGWLPTYYLELGFDVEGAGLPLTLFNLAMLPVSLGVTYLSDRHGRRRPFLIGACLLFLVGMVGLLVSPLALWWLWCLAMGCALGAVFALALALPIDLLDARRAGATVSLVFTVGYTGALASPLVAGALRDALGSFTLAFIPTLGLGLVMLGLVLILPETGRGIRGA